MRNDRIVFKDREEAGRKLAEKLASLDITDAAVFAMPRGGVPVGFQAAKALDAPLDTVIVRKLGAPRNPEFGFGAIAPGDVVVLNEKAIDSLGLSQSEINEVLRKERIELDRRMTHYQSGRFAGKFSYDTAVIVDDGLATGVSARAAIESTRLMQPLKRLIFASAVASEEAAEAVENLADESAILHVPEYFLTVGQWYERFNQVSDDEVLYLLHSAQSALAAKRQNGA